MGTELMDDEDAYRLGMLDQLQDRELLAATLFLAEEKTALDCYVNGVLAASQLEAGGDLTVLQRGS